MPTLAPGSTATDIIQPGQALTVTCDATATASVVEIGAPGAAPGTPAAVSAGAAYLVQASTVARYFSVTAALGSVTYTVADVPAGVSQGFSNTGSLPASGTVLDLDSDTTTVDAVLTRYGFSTSAAYLCRHARGTRAAPSATQSGDTMGVWGARGRGATGWVTGSKATIRVAAAENWTDSATGARLEFLTTSIGSTSNTLRFSISDAGRLSVGAIAQIPEYADDAAAQAGGLAVGAIYRTASVLKVRAA